MVAGPPGIEYHLNGAGEASWTGVIIAKENLDWSAEQAIMLPDGL
jgi:hypothetical protein